MRLIYRLSLLGVCASLAVSPVLAASTTRTVQKKQAEAERAELQQKLSALKRDINKTESAKDQAADALAESEQAISEANRSLRDLQDEQEQTSKRLRVLEEQHSKLQQKVDQQKNRLANFLKRQYVNGSNDRVKLLLSGDNPNRINRDLQYMSYLSQTQAKMIESLRQTMQDVEKNTADAKEAKEELDDIAAEEIAHKSDLEKQKKRHAQLISQLSDKLKNQRKQADTLERDEQRLGELVTRLNKLIEEQARLERERAAQEEKLRQERLAAQKARLAQQQAEAAQREKTGQKPAKPTKTPEPEAEPVKTAKPEPAPASDFNQHKGQMRLPVKGEILARFGTKRGDGPSWKGMLIKAPEGAEVKAIASGKVIFADWYKGYGNMIIVDHGNQYWSLYGNNQAVLKHVGDVVKNGDIIAHVGNTGGNEEPGLYFEMRYQLRAIDPQSWLGIK